MTAVSSSFVPQLAPPRRLLTALCLLAVALPLAGCHTVGPRAVHAAGIDYNQAMSGAVNEQVLLNLVRLRYRDAPYFLEPTELITSHVLGAGAAADAILGVGSAVVDFGVGASYEENPTVIYTPLSGEAFLERLLTPVQVETLYLLMRSGWSIERVLRCCVRQVNGLLNAPSADGPTPGYLPEYRDFRLLAEELRRLQKSRDLLLDSEVKTAKAADGKGAKEDASGHGAAKAAKAEDAEPDGSDSGSSKVVCCHEENSVAKAGEDAAEESRRFYLVLSPAAVEALHRLDTKQRDALFPRQAKPVGGAADAEPAVGAPTATGSSEGPTRLQLVPEQRSGTDGHVALHARSLMGVLYFLSQAVEVPQAHVDAGYVTATEDDPEAAVLRTTADPDSLNRPRGECAEERKWACPAGRACLDWSETVLGDLFRVRVSAKKPTVSAYVMVPYRGHWFYIPDCDLQSKSTYLLVKQLLSLQSGNPKDRASALNYSLGG